MVIKESAENYLETIYVLKEKNGNVRSIDVATELGFSKPSVSVAMKKFREEGYVIIDDAGYISLTESGLKIAAGVYERHEIIARALMAIGVSESVAYEDSCRIEHDISEETFDMLKKHIQKYV